MANVFKIDTQKITKDNVVDHYTSDYTFKSSFDYAKEVYNEHKSLLTIIPDELKNGTDKTYGCPDCGDQGGYYFLLEMSNGGIKKYTIDTDNTADQTSEIIEFKKKIANSIRVLKIMN